MADQPKWKFIANLGDASPVENGGLFLYFDETETYGFEMEKLEEPADDDRCETCENEPDEEMEPTEHAAWKAHVDKHERWTVYRVCLDRQKIVMVDDRRYVVSIAYHDEWPHPIANYVKWFMEDLGDVAESMGADREEMIADLCSDDGTKLANAYRAIFDYHGWDNGDSYPLRLSRTDVEARYTDGEL